MNYVKSSWYEAYDLWEIVIWTKQLKKHNNLYGMHGIILWLKIPFAWTSTRAFRNLNNGKLWAQLKFERSALLKLLYKVALPDLL